MDEIFNRLSWIDWTSLGVMAAFLLLGFVRGFLWQASRLAGIVIAYVVSGLYAADVGVWISQRFPELDGRPGYYAAYLAIFVAVLVVLSLITMALESFVRKLRMSFYDHLGGGVLGMATAAGLIVGALGLLYRAVPQSPIVEAARQSYTGEVSRFLVHRVGLPDPILALYEPRLTGLRQ